MKIDIKADVAAARRRLNNTQRQVLPKAVARALNRTGDHANTLTVRGLAKVSGLKQKDVRAAMARTRATWNRLSYLISATGRALNLIRFGARATKKGVSAAAWGVRKIYRGTFIANQGRTVFRRTHGKYMPSRKGNTKHSEAIVPMHGPSLPREFGRAEFLSNLKTAVAVKWRDEFSRQLNYYLNKGK